MSKVFFIFNLLLTFPNLVFASDNISANYAGVIFALFVFVTLLITFLHQKNQVVKVIIMRPVKKYLDFKMV